MASENRESMGDTETGAVITDIRTQRIGTARYLVADMAEAETEITVEAAVDERAMVQKTTLSTKMDRKLGAANIMEVKEVVRRRQDDGLRGMGEPPWGHPLASTGEGGASHLAPTLP